MASLHFDWGDGDMPPFDFCFVADGPKADDFVQSIRCQQSPIVGELDRFDIFGVALKILAKE